MAQNGGKRLGAGRPLGAINKKTRQMQEVVETTGITPLDYLLCILRDEDQEQVARVHAAIAAAPYVHAKLASSTVETDGKPTMITATARATRGGHLRYWLWGVQGVE